ncbi:MAG TPA: universal stress protein [Anaerolineales bacterium]|nr:universal stress protein [Anaerolineales bacterium]HUS85512.1 universal stress protein [Anaerolineales bacterium]
MRILIATDGLPHSEQAVHLGAKLAKAGRVKLTILSVVKSESDLPNAEKILDIAAASLPEGTPEFQTRTRVGNLAEEIVHEAKEGLYNLVVVGMCPGSTLLQRLLGPTGEWVLEHGLCSVIVVKGQAVLPKRILICDSGVDSSTLLDQFKHLFSDLLLEGTHLTVLHVMSQISAGPGVSGWELRAEADELIEANTPEGEILDLDTQVLDELQQDIEAKVRHGLVVDEIIAESRSGDYDLIVIGEHQNGFWERLVLDNLAHQIVAAADRPVMIIKKQTPEVSPK